MNNNNPTKVVIHFEDGSTREIGPKVNTELGFIIYAVQELEEDSDRYNLQQCLINVSRRDMFNIAQHLEKDALPKLSTNSIMQEMIEHFMKGLAHDNSDKH